MQLIVTQPIFLWIFGVFGILGVLLLVVLVVMFVQITKFVQHVNEKATDVAGTIDEVRATIHKATETINDTRDHIANFVTFTTSAVGIAKLVGSIRESWASHHPDDIPPKRSKDK